MFPRYVFLTCASLMETAERPGARLRHVARKRSLRMLAPEEQETSRSVKQPVEMPRLDQSTLDTVLANLLAQDPPALVIAIAENSSIVPMPTSVPLRGHV